MATRWYDEPAGPSAGDGSVALVCGGLAARAVSMELPGQQGRRSWAYLLKDAHGAVHLVDCGADSERNRSALGSALAQEGHGFGDLASVTATHVHYDHVGMAAWLRREHGTRVQLHHLDAVAMAGHVTYGGPDALDAVERWGVPSDRRDEVLAAAGRRVASGEPVPVDVHLEDGDHLDVPGWDLTVLATPGHTPGHLCVVHAESGSAFVGDHVLPRQNPGAGLGGQTEDNPVESYLDSIGRLAALNPTQLFPGHGDVIEAPADRLSAIRAHHVRRRRQVLEAAATSSTVWEMATKVEWSRGWDRLSGVLLFSALSQVESYLTATVDATDELDEECA